MVLRFFRRLVAISGLAGRIQLVFYAARDRSYRAVGFYILQAEITRPAVGYRAVDLRKDYLDGDLVTHATKLDRKGWGY